MLKKLLKPTFLYEGLLVKRAKIFGKVKQIPVNQLFLGTGEPFEVARPFVFKNGKEKRKLKESAYYYFLKAFVEGKRLEETDYFLWKKAAHNLHFAVTRTEKFIDLFRKMKNLKQEKSSLEGVLKPIIVFEDVVNWRGPKITRDRPLSKRKGYEPKNYEIYDGHHRAVVLAFLGEKKILCLMISPFL